MEVKTLLYPPVSGFIHLHHAGNALAGDAAGDVDGIAPQVVNEFLFADYAGDDRPRADPDAHFKMQLVDLEIVL